MNLSHFIESTKEELSDQQENIDNISSMHIGNPLQVQHKSQQPNRYKSGGKLPKKKARHIIQDIINTINKDYEEEVIASQDDKKCNQVGHYALCCSKSNN